MVCPGKLSAWGVPVFKRFLRNREGNFAVILSLAAFSLLTALAGAIDLTNALAKAGQLQNSLDSSALAIGTRYYSGMPQDALQGLGGKFFGANMVNPNAPADNDYLYEEAAPSLVASASMVNGSAIIKVSANVLSKSLFGSDLNWPLFREAYVQVFPGVPACVLALNETADDAVKLSGSTTVDMKGCVIAANSNAYDAVSRSGAARVAARCVTTVGQTEGLATSEAKLDCGLPLERQLSSLDPLGGVKAPAPGACTAVKGGKTKTLDPGTFCQQTFTGNITLNPGNYILRGGKIKLGGNGSLTGHGVTLFLTEGAEISINANEAIDLSPPVSGPYAGVTIYQEAANTTDLTINGTSGSKFSGFLYAPGAHIFFAGNSDMSGSGDCIRMVGDTIELTGNSNMASDCSSQLGGQTMYAGRRVLLVK
jgi:hypothetical protein